MTQIVYVGGYSTPDRRGVADGINVFAIDTPGGKWRHVQHVACFDNPSFLRIGPSGQVLFAVHGGRSAISSFTIDAASGRLEFRNRAETGGQNPVDLGFDPTGRHVVVAHYTSGDLVVLPIGPDGTIGALCQTIRLTGDPGPRTQDQPGPLPHGLTRDPTGRFLVIPDKGLDRIFVFEFIDGVLQPAPSPSAAATPGSGPRHAAFHPNLPILYVVCELNCAVEVFGWNVMSGALSPLQVISALPPGTQPNANGLPNLASEIAVSSSGRQVYSSNRGHHSIARFAVDPRHGTLSFQDCMSELVEEPRMFALDTDGTHLHVANQTANTIATFNVDPLDGHLSDGRISARTGTPTAICFLPN
jgi:6-phosphogluconolactonase (cycloisomerase 2 family)